MSAERPTPRVATPGTFDIFAQSEIIGKVRFTGGNAIGPQLVMELPNVMFRPANNAIGMIQDEWGQLQITGEVLHDEDGIFGTITHPDTTLVSPLVSQYYIGKGVIEIQLAGDTSYADIGNVPVFEFAPNITTLPHFSSRFGIRSKDLEVITEKAATLNITMEEWTYRNLQFAFMGAASAP